MVRVDYKTERWCTKCDDKRLIAHLLSLGRCPVCGHRTRIGPKHQKYNPRKEGTVVRY